MTTPVQKRLLKSFICLAILVALGCLVRTVPAQDQPEAKQPARMILVADSSAQRIAIVNEDNQTVWEREIGPLHDLHMLENGHLLIQLNWTHVVEIDPDSDKIVWEYDSAAAGGNRGKAVEVHAFQRLADGNTMIAESGPARIIEVTPEGKIAAEVALTVEHPHPHRDTRLVRKLDSGNYLVCHEGDGTVREYTPAGEIAWEYVVPMFDRQPADGHGPESFGNKCFSAIRLENGHTLIGTGNGHSVIEVTPEKEIVWKLAAEDLSGIELAWITSIQHLPSGNILIGNCHAGPDNPQIIEVDREKKVVWKFHDFERFGNSLTNSQVLAVDGAAIAAVAGRDR